MRQPQRVWKTFYRLKLRANFFLGNHTFEKTSFCTARLNGSDISRIKFIAPWKPVRSDEFVNKRITPITQAQLDALNDAVAHRNEKNKKVLAQYTEGQPPYTKEQLEGTPYTGGKTHYVGDDCPGGHCEVAQGAPAPTIKPS